MDMSLKLTEESVIEKQINKWSCVQVYPKKHDSEATAMYNHLCCHKFCFAMIKYNNLFVSNFPLSTKFS